MCDEKIQSLRYSEWTKVDIRDSDALRRYGIPEVARQNLDIFSNLRVNFYENLSTRAVSPLTGKRISPLKHFGIDSDPWMHSILFRERQQFYIFICLGLTYNSVLGAIFIPGSNIILENRDSWYYSCIFKRKIGRNILRVISYFNSFLGQPPSILNGKRDLVAAVGNARVGDFIMQLSWLNYLLEEKATKDFSLSKILVNKRSDFFDLSELFTGQKDMVLRLQSLGHIEYYTRESDSTLVSGAFPLGHVEHMARLKEKFSEYVKKACAGSENSAVPPDFDKCALRVWLSLELEKRLWAEQIEGLSTIIDALARKYLREGETVGLVFNGMTGVEGGEMPWYICGLIAREQSLIEEIRSKLRCRHKVFNLAGKTLRVKTLFASGIDFIVAPLGSASLLPSLIFDKPGVVYGNNVSDLRSFVGRNTIILDEKNVTDVHALKGVVNWRGTGQCVSYSIAPYDIVKVIEDHFTAGQRREAGRAVIERNPVGAPSSRNEWDSGLSKVIPS